MIGLRVQVESVFSRVGRANFPVTGGIEKVVARYS